MHKNNTYSTMTSKFSYQLNKKEDEIFSGEYLIDTYRTYLNNKKSKIHKDSARSYIKLSEKINEYYRSLIF